MSLNQKKMPTLGAALVPVLSLIVLLFVGIYFLEADPHVPLILASVVAALMGVRFGFGWKELQEAIIKGISLSMPAILILML